MNKSIAWSNSRIKLLRECPYKYYLYYILSDGGWRKSSSPESQHTYMLKKMVNLPLLAGSLVHDKIEHVIRSHKMTNRWMSTEASVNSAIDNFTTGLKQSKNKEWKLSPTKNVNLYEDYYGDGVSEEQIEFWKEKITTCLNNFYQCDIFRVLQKINEDDYLTLEDFQKFQFNTGEEIFVKIDLGFKCDGCINLIDWKTGKFYSNVVEQLVTYSMFALKQKWVSISELDKINIVPVYLSSNDCISLTVNIDQIKKQSEIIRQEYPLLIEANDNRNNRSYFSKTENKDQCERCFFKEICQ